MNNGAYIPLNIGFGNSVLTGRIISIISPDSSAGKRLREDAKNSKMLIDSTQGRKCRAIIITDSNHIILSALSADALASRIQNLSNTLNEPVKE